MKPGSMQSHVAVLSRFAGLLLTASTCCWLIGADPEAAASSKPVTEPFPPFTNETARTYLETVLSSFTAHAGNRVESSFIRARFHSYLGQQDDAERWARAALDEDHERADIHLFLSDLFIRQSRLEEARDSLRAALAVDHSLEGAHRRLGLVLDQLGDRSGAHAAFTTGVERDPQDADARLLLGQMLLDQDDVPAAILHLEHACRLDPTSPNAYYALAQAQLRAGEPGHAQGTLRIFQELKRKEQAAADAENVARDDARSMRILGATLHTEIATYHIETGLPKLAENHLRQAVAITPDESLGYETLATFLLQSGRRQDAVEVCQTLVRLRPENPAYRVNLGTLLLELHQFPAAVRELERALELDPQMIEPLQNLARFHLSARQDPGRALELCRRLVELAPTAAHYDLLAWASFANGLTAEARAASARSVELDPTNAIYQKRLQRLQQLP
jgi:tetratricopeptide (TPR) repeat protein